MDTNLKILVTGALGLVGSACVAFFEEKGWDVVGIDANMRAHFFNTPKQYSDKANLFDIDIRDRVSIDELFEKHHFDAIIHAAGQPSHDWATDDPLTDFDVNARGTLVLLEATRKYCPDAVFVYVSTDKVYGNHMYRSLEEMPTRYHSKHPFAEDLPLDETSRSLFGCSKIAADFYVQEYGRYFGMKTACFRPGCITGKAHEGAEQHGFLAYLAKCIKEGKTYKVFGYKGKQVRDQIHAYDLASAFYEFIKKPREGAVYNIGGGPERSVSVLEAAKLIEENTGKIAQLEFVKEHRKSDRQWDVHDTTKFRSDYPKWMPVFDLAAIINDVCEKV